MSSEHSPRRTGLPGMVSPGFQAEHDSEALKQHEKVACPPAKATAISPTIRGRNPQNIKPIQTAVRTRKPASTTARQGPLVSPKMLAPPEVLL